MWSVVRKKRINWVLTQTGHRKLLKQIENLLYIALILFLFPLTQNFSSTRYWGSVARFVSYSKDRGK